MALSESSQSAQVQKISVITNQFKMAIGSNAPQMYQYPLRLERSISNKFGEDAASTYLSETNELPCTLFEMQKVVDRNKKKIEMLIGKFLFSGFNIWTE